MGESVRRGAGAPFYAPPPRRKTSAEIISEARAALYGEAGGAAGGAASGAGGVLRPLRTRRPYTPRDPQRTLFAERAHKRDARPPSAFDLKQLTLSESVEHALVGGPAVAAADTAHHGATSSGDTKKQAPSPKKTNPSHKLGIPERSGDGWSGFPKLPHLSGRSKPLHRRSTLGSSLSEETKDENDLSQSISVVQPLKGGEKFAAKPQSPGPSSKPRHYVKSVSCDAGGLGDVAVKHLAVQLPHTSLSDYNNLSFIEIAESLNQRHRDIDRSLLLIDSLQKLLAVNIPSPNIQELLLRALYSHFDVEDERLMAAIARSMFLMRVTKQHLAAACKLVFKLARNDKNDHFFKNSDLLELLIEGCGRADPLAEAECCVYGAGALRFLAMDAALCAAARSAGALHLAALHMKILNNAKSENPRSVSDQSTHALFQLTGALRNLAGAGGEGSDGGAGAGGPDEEVVDSGALDALLQALAVHTDRDVLTNVARCLSVVSTRPVARAAMSTRAGGVRALLRCLAACAARAPLAVRLAYVLGNLCAHRNVAAQILNEEGGVDVLLTILESYTKRNENGFRDNSEDPDLQLVGTDLGGSDGSNEDVLIKTVRVVANLCLSEGAGAALAAAHAPRALLALRRCLALAATPVAAGAAARGAGRARREELAAAALAAINNVTFYRDVPLDALDQDLDLLCKECVWWVGRGARGEAAAAAAEAEAEAGEAGDAAAEALRALGNLSRSAAAAQAIVLHGVLDHLDPFFHHEDVGVRCSAAGVLVNICGAGAGGGGAAAAAARALLAAARAGDAAPAALLVRALWNAHAQDALDAADARRAMDALNYFLDDDSVFAACEATRSDRRASDPEISSSHVEFDLDNNPETAGGNPKPFSKAYSVDQDLHLQSSGEAPGGSSDDVGFEDDASAADADAACACAPCRRLADWEELVAVAMPLMDKLRPPRTDASVGTDDIYKSVQV